MAPHVAWEMAIPSPGLYPGLKILIQGTTTHNSPRFDINLETKGVSIPLHISFRFQEGAIVRNTLNDRGGWGIEERSGGMPLVRGKPFKILLECKSNAISIYINSVLFCQYAHRVPFHTINNLSVVHDVQITGVTFGGSQPTPAPAQPQLRQESLFHNIREEVIPTSSSRYSSAPFLANTIVKLNGNIPANSNRFDINFVSRPTNEIALHISVRFSEQCIVRNAFIRNAWGHEERIGGMPLTRGTPLRLDVHCKPQYFSITFNNKKFCDFTHRMPFEKITHMTFERDVEIRTVNYVLNQY